MLKQAQQAYKVLEEEFLTGMKASKERCKELEILLRKSDEKTRKLNQKYSSKDQEQTKTISNLIHLVQDLKHQLKRINDSSESTAQKLQERIHDLTAKLKAYEYKNTNLVKNIENYQIVETELNNLKLEHKSLTLRYTEMSEKYTALVNF
jgi:DNA repair exonuclease SbcCD ATPase subunit